MSGPETIRGDDGDSLFARQVLREIDAIVQGRDPDDPPLAPRLLVWGGDSFGEPSSNQAAGPPNASSRENPYGAFPPPGVRDLGSGALYRYDGPFGDWRRQDPPF